VAKCHCQRLRLKGCVGEMQDSTSCLLNFAMKTERLVGIDEFVHCIALYGRCRGAEDMCISQLSQM